MNKVSMLGTAGMLLGGLLVSTCALAQSDREEVTVVAPYITHESQTVNGTGNKGVYDVNSITKEVTYSDLDLSKPSDADMFIQRINDTAKESCAELKAKFPDPPHAPVTSDNECVKNASAQALILADSLISRAKVAILVPVEPQPQQTAEIAPQPEPAPVVEAEATTPAPVAVAPKQDRN